MRYRYQAAALGLRLFSANDIARRCYRAIGNTVVARRRAAGGLPETYRWRARNVIRALRTQGCLQPGMRVLEIGTGWAHWDALVIRLAAGETRSVLYDVWDNRSKEQFRAFARGLLEPSFSELFDPSARECLERALRSSEWGDIYKQLGFEYVVDPDGELAGIDGKFDVVVSSDVLEHVPKAKIPALLRAQSGLLKPGGVACHQIVLFDHLRIYARDAHPKQYLAYPEEVWHRRFENGVQHQNRVQMPAWREHFREAGLRILDERAVQTCDLDGFPLAPQFAGVSQPDLEVGVVQMVCTV